MSPSGKGGWKKSGKNDGHCSGASSPGKNNQNKGYGGGKACFSETGGEYKTPLRSAAAHFQPAMYGAVDPFSRWPLPYSVESLWTEYFHEDGTPYYHNKSTGLTQWEKPPELEKAPSPLPFEPVSVGQLSTGPPQRNVPSGKASGKDRSHSGGERAAGSNGSGRARGSAGGDNRKQRQGKGETVFGPPGCNLFVFHLPDDWQDEDIHEYFSPHGNLISAKVMKELGTGRSRGFGFVSYEDRVAAATAIKKMQGYKVLGKRLKVEFKKGEGGDADGADGKGSAGDCVERGEKAYPDDERLIGYLRSMSAKDVVQSLAEDTSGMGCGAEDGGDEDK